MPHGTAKRIKTNFKIIVKSKLGGLAVENLPTNARDMDLIPGLGRFHMCWGQLSPQMATTEPTHACAHAPQQEKSLQPEAHPPQLEKAHAQQQRPSPTRDK